MLSAASLAALLSDQVAYAQSGKTLTIAYNTTLPSLDPTNSAKTSSPAVQSIFKAIFDPYVDQNPDLSFRPGALTKWGWNKDKTAIELTLRKGMFWHDGTPVTTEDLVWSLQRAGDEKNGNPMQFMWHKLGGFTSSGDTVVAEVEKFERDAFIRLRAFPKYWGAKPTFETVVFKFVPDPASRVAEIESGAADMTLEVPYEEYDRLIAKPGLTGAAYPMSDIGILFITDREPMLDRNVRLAAVLQYYQPVVHKKTITFTPHRAGTIAPQSITPA